MHVGMRVLSVPDEVQGARIPVRVLYPTSAAPSTERTGPYAIDVAVDAPVEGERLPLVVVSHGDGATPLVHRGLAMEIARAGFAAVLVQHPGNSRNDNALSGSVANLVNRPRHMRLAIDAALADEALGPHLVSEGIAALGDSIGGYTALVLAGGRASALPSQSEDGVARALVVEADTRVTAAVLLVPALAWLMGPGALDAVGARLLVRTGEQDTLTPPYHVESVLAGLPPGTPLDYEVVRGAGHFSFLSPFPAAMVQPSFLPAHDPPGFDRAAYQPRLAADVLRFLRAR
jgi:predicted dienelactone hydrolase